MTTHSDSTLDPATRTIGVDMGADSDVTALVVNRSWPDGTATLDSVVLADDEKMGLSIMFGIAPLNVMSFHNVQRGAIAVAALAVRLGVDMREFSRAFLDWSARR